LCVCVCVCVWFCVCVFVCVCVCVCVCMVCVVIDLYFCSCMSVGPVQYVISPLFASFCYFLITRPMFLILFLCLFSCFVLFAFHFVYSALLYLFCIISPSVYSCLFLTFVQVYRPQPLGGTPVVIKINILSYRIIYHIISYIIYHIISYKYQ